MAILKSNTLSLEVKRRDTMQSVIIHDFRVTCQGKDLIPAEVRNHDKQSSADGMFLVPVREEWPLHSVIQQVLNSNQHKLWCSLNEWVTVALYPCWASLVDLYRWATPDGQKWIRDDMDEHECNWEPEDKFTLIIHFSASHYLQGQQDGQPSDFGFTFYTIRKELEAFSRELSFAR